MRFLFFFNASRHFLEKSLKHNRSLFWCFVGMVVPSAKPDKNTNAISIGPWFTVVPIHPCSTICRIFGSDGSWLVAAASSMVFFWISSIATSIGSSTFCDRAMTWIRVLTYGKWLAVVRIVFRLHCSCNSPCALPFFVNGVEKMKRSVYNANMNGKWWKIINTIDSET